MNLRILAIILTYYIVVSGMYLFMQPSNEITVKTPLAFRDSSSFNYSSDPNNRYNITQYNNTGSEVISVFDISGIIGSIIAVITAVIGFLAFIIAGIGLSGDVPGWFQMMFSLWSVGWFIFTVSYIISIFTPGGGQ